MLLTKGVTLHLTAIISLMACENPIQNVLKSLLPDDVYFVVGESNPSVNDGQAVEADTNTFTIPSFIGWKVRLIRGGIPQYQGNPGNGNIFFEYTSITGEFTLTLNTGFQEEFICQAYKPA